MATSQNGWPASADRQALGIDEEFSAGGVLIAGGVLAGDVATVLGHVAEQVHRRVERLVAGWCWGHAYRPIRGQTTGLSNHASGTAMDLNAPNHPQGSRGTFSAAAVREIRAILAEVGGVVRWGGDWTGTSVDEMHFEIIGGPSAVADIAARLRGATEEDDVALTDADITKIAERTRSLLLTANVTNIDDRKAGRKGPWLQDALRYCDVRTWAILAELRAMRGELGDDEANLLAALKADGADLDPAAVAEHLAPLLLAGGGMARLSDDDVSRLARAAADEADRRDRARLEV